MSGIGGASTSARVFAQWHRGTVSGNHRLSPYWRLSTDAEVIAAADGLLWFDAADQVLHLVRGESESTQLLLRAVISGWSPSTSMPEWTQALLKNYRCSERR